MTYLQDATHSSTLVGTSSNGVSQIACVMPWKDHDHEETNILLVRPKSSAFADSTIWSDVPKLPSRVTDPFHANITISDHRVNTDINIEQESFYETIIQDGPRPEVSVVPVQAEYNSESFKSERITQLTMGYAKGRIEEFLASIISVKHQWFTFSISSDLSAHAIVSFHADPTTSLNPGSVYRCGMFITANIEREVSHKTNIQYSQRREILDRFDVLAQREDNWDGYESKKPTQLTLDHAKFLMVDLLDTIISAEYSWITPFISSDEDGDITAEWYEGERELHLLIRENEAEYLQVWGTNIDIEMHEDFLSRDDYPTLWEWLLYGQKRHRMG